MRKYFVFIITSFSISIIFAQAPGDVSENLMLWLKADAGTNSNSEGDGITSWIDQSDENNDAVGSGEATFRELFTNYNAGINFSNSVQPVTGNITRPIGTGSSIFIVGQFPFVANRSLVEFGDGVSRAYLHDDNYAAESNAPHFSMQSAIPSIWGIRDPGGMANSFVYEDGGLLHTQEKLENTDWTTGATYFIGDDQNGNNEFVGQIAEVIYFDQQISILNKVRVESYLAIKYGVTLDNSAGGDAGDYLASDGTTTLWDASTNIAYHHNIIGIGRDDSSELVQKQSHALDDTTRIYIGNLSVDNISNPASFNTDGQFVLVGHNQGQMYATEAAALEMPMDVASRLEREWAISNTAFDGTFGLDLTINTCADLTSINTDDLRLLVDDDGDFSDALLISSADGLSFSANGSIITILGIDNVHLPINSTRYVTLGSVDESSTTLDLTSTANAGIDFPVCSNAADATLNGFVTIATGGVWSGGGGVFFPDENTLDAVYTPTPEEISNGEVTLTLTTTGNGACSADSDQVLITINPAPIALAGQDEFICNSESFYELDGFAENFDAVSWSSTGDGIFLFDGDEFRPSYIFGEMDLETEMVQLVITAVGQQNCVDVSDTISLEISNPVSAAFTTGATCIGLPTDFINTTAVAAGEIDMFNWDFGNGFTSDLESPSVVFKELGDFTVQLVVTSSLGCTDSISQPITVAENPIAGFSSSMLDVPVNFEFELVDESELAEQWAWDFGDQIGFSDAQNPSYMFSETGEYQITLTVFGETGCVDSTSRRITVMDQIVLPPRIPSAFTPNADNENDALLVRGGPFLSLDFKVYDNWGKEIFQSTSQDIGWDGTSSGGDLLPVGVYVYTIKAVNLNGESFDFLGRVTLVR